MITVTKIFEFEACHHLPYYRGACHGLHGHSYKLEITVKGGIIKDKKNPKYGMIVDFKDLKEIVNSLIINELDHKNLNEIFDNPTAECMVLFISSVLEGILEVKYGCILQSVKLWETSTSYAEWKRG